MATITELTKKYIDSHPSIRDCLTTGLINYSALARQIRDDLNISSKSTMEAVLIAARRYAERAGNGEKLNEKKIREILKGCNVEVRNRVVTIILEKNFYTDNLIEIEKKIKKEGELFYSVEGLKVITVITSEKYLEEIKKAFKNNILNVSENLATIMLRTSKEIEQTKGVMAYLLSLLASEGINVNETMSCWTDTLFVVSEKDIAAVMELFKF